MRLADASSDVSTGLLPALTPELFVAAGALVVQRLASEGVGAAKVEEVLRRVVDQCGAIIP